VLAATCEAASSLLPTRLSPRWLEGTRGLLVPTAHAEGGAAGLAEHLVGAAPLVVIPGHHFDQGAVHDLNGVDGTAITTSVVITSRTRLPVMGPPRSTPLPLDGVGWLRPPEWASN
jgi:hypothetical protein